MQILKLTQTWNGLPPDTALIVWERGMQGGFGRAVVDPKRAETLLALGVAEKPLPPEPPATEADIDESAPRRKRTKKARG